MPYQKDHKKLGGRVKGVPNKTTGITKQVISNLVSAYADGEHFAKDFSDLEPKERLEVFIKLVAFIVPKPQSVDIGISAETRTTIEEKLAQLACL
jgi:hypothetical protein